MPRPLRIANVLFDDRFGGPHKRVIEVAVRLNERGISTLIYLPCGSGNAEDIAHRRGIEVKRIEFVRPPRLGSVARVLKWAVGLFGDVLRFRAEFRRQRVDAVHVNGAFFLAPALGAKLAGLPLVWHLNDTIVNGVLRSVFGGIVNLLADRIAVAARAVAEHYGISARKHIVLYAPVDTEWFAKARATARPNEVGRRRIVLVANWNPIKGIEYFIDAAAMVLSQVPNSEFVIVGARVSGHECYAKMIEGLIDRHGLRDVLIQAGFVEDVATVLATTDLLVLSSISEACPICVLEAMAAGVPVVASDVGGVRELLEAIPQEPAGEVVPPRDSTALAVGMVRMLKDIARANSYGSNGRKIATSFFDIAVCVDAHEKLYREVLSEKSCS